MRAHPCSRGENLNVMCATCADRGSSPLTRGKRSMSGHTHTPWAHPRSRGENGQPPTTARPIYGSSPLTRGKRILTRVRSYASGLIPAHAGKTAWVVSCIFGLSAHPRSRGENGDEVDGPVGESGSSPLTRGKLDTVVRETNREGLIPAHAGKTRTPTQRCATIAAHPRSRGENSLFYVRTHTPWGSSPLTRGKPRTFRAARYFVRLIPAHAGKTTQVRRCSLSGGAHPRSRGENRGPTDTPPRRRGSSPLTRGKHLAEY